MLNVHTLGIHTNEAERRIGLTVPFNSSPQRALRIQHLLYHQHSVNNVK